MYANDFGLPVRPLGALGAPATAADLTFSQKAAGVGLLGISSIPLAIIGALAGAFVASATERSGSEDQRNRRMLYYTAGGAALLGLAMPGVLAGAYFADTRRG